MKQRVLFLLCASALVSLAATNSPRKKSGGRRGAATPAPFTQSAPLDGAESVAPGESKLITAELGGRDLRFLTEALEHGLEQVFLGELAKTKGVTEQVKGLSGVLAQTQQEENKKLARLAAMKGVTLGAREAAAQKSLADKFAQLEGPKFDKTWFAETIALNERAVANYETALDSPDADIKGFAEKALPLAREKLFMVNKMTGNAPRGGSGPAFRTGSATPPPQTPLPAVGANAAPAAAAPNAAAVAKATPVPPGRPATPPPMATPGPAAKTTPAPSATPPTKSTPPSAALPAPKSTPAPAAPAPASPAPKATPSPASPAPNAAPPVPTVPAAPLPKTTPAPAATPPAR